MKPVRPLRAHKFAKRRAPKKQIETETEEFDCFEDEEECGEEPAHFEGETSAPDEDSPMSQFDDWNNTVDELSGTSDEDAPQYFGG